MGGLILIGAFVGFATVGEIIAIAIGMLTDHFSENFSMMLFFVLSAVVVLVAWPLAVRVTNKVEA